MLTTAQFNQFVYKMRRDERLCVVCADPAGVYVCCERCRMRRRTQQAVRRSSLGLPRKGPQGRKPYLTAPDWDNVDWRRPVAELARELGVDTTSVYYQRRRRAGLTRAGR